jgi:hypothetical protein
MSASKNRPRWDQLPPSVRTAIEQLAGGTVIRARNCPGGYSAGFASVLTMAAGGRLFVKAIDADRWPTDADYYRVEAKVSAALPEEIPAPRLHWTFENDHWVVLAFEAISGTEPMQPWNHDELERVVAAIAHLAKVGTPSPVALSRDNPRLGGWSALTDNPAYLNELGTHSRWAADHIDQLVGLEREGRAAARGDSLVHCDLSPHNILLTPDRVVFVDWPAARLGAPVLDLIVALSSAPPADRVDRQSILDNHYSAIAPRTINAILAAHAGALFRDGVSPKPPGLEPIATISLQLGLSALTWLQRRLADGPRIQR